MPEVQIFLMENLGLTDGTYLNVTASKLEKTGVVMMNEFKVKGKELLEKVEELIKEGNARRIIIKDEKGRTYIEIPVTIGIIGALCSPILAAVGALAGMAANFTIEVVRKENGEEPKPRQSDYNL